MGTKYQEMDLNKHFEDLRERMNGPDSFDKVLRKTRVHVL